MTTLLTQSNVKEIIFMLENILLPTHIIALCINKKLYFIDNIVDSKGTLNVGRVLVLSEKIENSKLC